MDKSSEYQSFCVLFCFVFLELVTQADVYILPWLWDSCSGHCGPKTDTVVCSQCSCLGFGYF